MQMGSSAAHWESIVSRCIKPTQGILAGSVWATFEIAAYALDTIVYVNTLRATTTISLHIDGLDVFCAHDDPQVAVQGSKTVLVEAKQSVVPKA